MASGREPCHQHQHHSGRCSVQPPWVSGSSAVPRAPTIGCGSSAPADRCCGTQAAHASTQTLPCVSFPHHRAKPLYRACTHQLKMLVTEQTSSSLTCLVGLPAAMRAPTSLLLLGWTDCTAAVVTPARVATLHHASEQSRKSSSSKADKLQSTSYVTTSLSTTCCFMPCVADQQEDAQHKLTDLARPRGRRRRRRVVSVQSGRWTATATVAEGDGTRLFQRGRWRRCTTGAGAQLGPWNRSPTLFHLIGWLVGWFVGACVGEGQ